MTELLGSPTRSGNNAFLERYVQNLTPETPLKPLSASKINSSSNLQSALHVTPNLANSKENDSRSPLATPTRKFKARLKTTNIRDKVSLSFDMSHLSKDEIAYYEFLCRVGEVKRWIETVTGEQLPSELDLCVGDSLRNGVYLALLTQKINPDLAPTVFPAGDKLQFKHTQNINVFFSLVDHVGLPESFRFELQDLYNKKNLPQVFETLYILITIITKKWPTRTPAMESVSGQLTFSKEDLRICKRAWPRIRDFKSLNVSPISSPVSKKTGSPVKTGLIDFRNAYETEAEPSSPVPIQTPTKRAESHDFPVLSPTSETESLFASSKSTRSSPTRPLNFNPGVKDMLSDTPRLDYSPMKNFSMSYYSPSISKYLTYDTDYYRLRSQARERDMDYYQSMKYGPLDYSPKRKQRMTELEFLDSVIQLQCLCRSVNLRFHLQIQKNLLGIFRKEIHSLQSRIRAKSVRNNPSLRAVLDRDYSRSLAQFQAAFRGTAVRQSLDICRLKLLRREETLAKLQSICKSSVLRRNTRSLSRGIRATNTNLISFQALLRGIRQRALRERSPLAQSDISKLQQLQATCLGFLARKQQLIKLKMIEEMSPFACLVQSRARGSSVRSTTAGLMSSLTKYEMTISNLIGCIQANRKRSLFSDALYGEFQDAQSLIRLQAVTKGILVRYTLDLVDNIIEINHLCDLQAHLKGSLHRTKLSERNSLFRCNARSVILIQSKLRMFLQRSAYLDLMHCPNPSLWSVRKFSHLLNGIGTIEGEQNRLEGSQAQLDAENSRKEKLENEVRKQIDMREVLDSYHLSSDYAMDTGHLKIPKRKFPAYEKLFYLLQVDTAYWKQIYCKDKDFFLRNVYVTFCTVNQKMGKREKLLFIRLLADIIQLDMSEANSVRQFVQSSDAPWVTLLKLFLRREYPDLFTLFVPLLKYLADPEISFESNPAVIFAEIHGFQPPTNVSAVEDEKTSAKFVQNLRSLWHAIELVAMLFSRKMTKITPEVRFLCTKVFCSAADKNADDVDMRKAISLVLVQCFCAEYLEQRAHYGFKDSVSSDLERKIETVIGALITVFSGSKFSSYYDPLNAYSKEINPQVRELLMSTLIDPEYEHDGDQIIYTDMVSSNPQLEILSEKAALISCKIQENLLHFPEDDAMHDVLKDMKHLSPSTGRVVLDLAPSAYRFLVTDDKTRKLYDRIKRAFIYMTQVEEINTNLYDLALSCVLPQDEPRFQALIAANRGIQRDPMIEALSSSSYFDLKNSTLKKIHELESLGIINPVANRLQNFLNDIANTIKDPHYAVSYVIRELDITKQTLHRICQINMELERELIQQKKSIKRVFGDIQQSRNYVSPTKSTFSNLKDAYKKAQKKSSEMEGLKFKWTTRQLYEKGIVKSIAGEKLAEQKIKVFGSSGPQFPEVIFKISTSDGIKYGIQLMDKRKGPEKKHQDSVDSFNLEDLLSAQVGTKLESLKFFSGKVVVNTSALLGLVVSTFLNSEIRS